MRILLTGFEPFEAQPFNPSWELALRVAQTRDDIEARLLPVSFARALPSLFRAFDEVRPDATVLLGLAVLRTTMTLERVAINLDDARIPDNEGFRPIDRPIVFGAPDAYFSTLPVKAMMAAMVAAGAATALSYTAGTYLCNHVFFGLRHRMALQKLVVPCGFCHVPPFNIVPADIQVAAMNAALDEVIRAESETT